MHDMRRQNLPARPSPGGHPLLVKICGVANAADAAAVLALRPDAMGFVFWPRSPRAVQPALVADWMRGSPPGLLKVGVFVDASPDEVRRTVEVAGLNVVQWHNDRLPPPPIPAGCRLWQVARVGAGRVPGESGFRGQAATASQAIDALLLDSYNAETPGGTGRTVDWTAARQFVAQSALPVLLAGGLNPDNVAAAVRAVRPRGVDVSSGVEAAPGRKDLARVKAFIDNARRHGGGM